MARPDSETTPFEEGPLGFKRTPMHGARFEYLVDQSGADNMPKSVSEVYRSQSERDAALNRLFGLVVGRCLRQGVNFGGYINELRAMQLPGIPHQLQGIEIVVPLRTQFNVLAELSDFGLESANEDVRGIDSHDNLYKLVELYTRYSSEDGLSPEEEGWLMSYFIHNGPTIDDQKNRLVEQLRDALESGSFDQFIITEMLMNGMSGVGSSQINTKSLVDHTRKVVSVLKGSEPISDQEIVNLIAQAATTQTGAEPAGMAFIPVFEYELSKYRRELLRMYDATTSDFTLIFGSFMQGFRADDGAPYERLKSEYMELYEGTVNAYLEAHIGEQIDDILGGSSRSTDSGRTTSKPARRRRLPQDTALPQERRVVPETPDPRPVNENILRFNGHRDVSLVDHLREVFPRMGQVFCENMAAALSTYLGENYDKNGCAGVKHVKEVGDLRLFELKPPEAKGIGGVMQKHHLTASVIRRYRVLFTVEDDPGDGTKGAISIVQVVHRDDLFKVVAAIRNGQK